MNIWVYQCTPEELKRAYTGGEGIHNHRKNRDIKNNDQSSGRIRQERNGKIGEEGLTSLIRMMYTYLPIPDVDYTLYQMGTQTKHSSDIGELYLKVYTPEVYKSGGVRLGERENGKQKLDRFGRFGPSWLIDNFLSVYFDDNAQCEKHTIGDDCVLVLGFADQAGLCRYYGWITYGDIRRLHAMGLTTPMYKKDTTHKRAFFLCDLMKQKCLRPMDELKDSQITKVIS